jgi:NADH-quinone oxidoreductase subunit L
VLDLLWLVPALPFAGFLTLALTRARLARAVVAWIGVGSVGIAAAVTIGIAIAFLSAPPPEHVYTQTLWSWFAIGGFNPLLRLYLDPLSLVMTLMITVVGFLIHLYSAEFMADEEGYNRFFAYMNLFVSAMLALVLADNLLFLYLGWEGVGLCSYLLIGFWYRDPANGRAARKAFIVTRVGDTAFAIGLFVLFTHLGTLDIPTLLARAPERWPVDSGLAIAAAALLLGGAVGKSAQLPLQTWLPDAMAGPTPVSALIHAATMVTAGVYLIARLHPLYLLAPSVQLVVAVIGALTLLLAGVSALMQSDIKRVLAYSTVSQIGYMFLALGVGAWTAAIFHFLTHAFFKALLFLSAGAISYSLHHEYNLFRMGGLWRRLPFVFWTFLIGAAALASLPLITAGFYSKDLILYQVWSSREGGPWLWSAGLIGTLLTALYIFRVVFIAFFGEAKTPVSARPGLAMRVPLAILALFSLVAGFIQTPTTLGHNTWLARFLGPVFPPAPLIHGSLRAEVTLDVLAAGASLFGLYLAYRLFVGIPVLANLLVATRIGGAISRYWAAGWGFDWLYDRLFVRPLAWFVHINRRDAIDALYSALADLSVAAYRALSHTQTGQVRWYAGVIAAGALILIAMAVLP